MIAIQLCEHSGLCIVLTLLVQLAIVYLMVVVDCRHVFVFGSTTRGVGALCDMGW